MSLVLTVIHVLIAFTPLFLYGGQWIVKSTSGTT
jgi:uncharacterized membrane protein